MLDSCQFIAKMRKNERKEEGKNKNKNNTIISSKWVLAFNIRLVAVTCLSKCQWEEVKEREYHR